MLVASVLAFVLGWAIFRLTDWFSPPVAVGATLIRPVDPDRDHIRGNPDAPLTLVEYGDFECPFCSRATGSIDEVRAHFGDELRYVWRHLPLERVHPRAMDAARASEAAALQGKFFEMAATMFEFQDYLEWEHIYRYADGVGLRHQAVRRGPALAEGAAPGRGRRAGRRADGPQLDADVLRQRQAAQGPVGLRRV